MFALKGSNVRLSSKPAPIPVKARPGFPKLNMNSPYYQEQTIATIPARRIQSATNCRNNNQIPMGKPKSKSIYRKQSEPIIRTESIYSHHRITTIQPRAPSSVSISSRGKFLTPAHSEVSGEGDGGDRNWNRVRPLSANSTSNSNNSDVFLLGDEASTLPYQSEKPHVFTSSAAMELKIVETSTNDNCDSGQPGRSSKNEMRMIDLDNEDEILLSESDNILQDVASFCDEIGLGSSFIDSIRSKRKNSHNSSPDLETGRVCIESSKTNPEKEIQEKIIQEISTYSSRPNSAISQLSLETSQGQIRNQLPEHYNPNLHIQNEGISRIISTLRLIEEEEKKGCEIAAQFGDFFRQKLSPTKSSVSVYNDNSPPSYRPASPSTTRSGIENPISSRTPRFGHLPQSKDSTPRLPPIHVPHSQPEPPPISPGLSNFSVHSARSSVFTREQCYDDEEIDQIQYRGSPLESPPPLFEKVEYSGQVSGPKAAICEQPISLQTTDEKARNIFSFLDQVEKSDRDVLFNLKFDSLQTRGGPPSSRTLFNGNGKSIEFPASTMDTLIRKGSVELAREVILLERKVEEMSQNVTILEETLMSQRELNVRNIKNSQKDLKKRLKIQQEEFELALSRHQAFVDQLLAEKRGLQDKCEKVLKDSKDSEQRYQQQIKSLQEKHLDELKRIRKLQGNAEKTRKQNWVGSKTQEIRELTVKGLEPEVQRIIQRHQQEMTEMRAWHADELKETEERYARKQTMHLQELRDTFNREKEEACRREREIAQKRFDSDLNRMADEYEVQKKRLIHEMQGERERFNLDETRLKELMQENVRKAQIKGEVEMENQKQEYDNKILNLEKRYEGELKSLKDVYENQRENLLLNHTKKFELTMTERENSLQEQFQNEKEKLLKEKELKLKEEFEKTRSEEELALEARIKRMQDKFQFELTELEKSEFELKQKFSQMKTEVLAKEEMIFSLKTTLGLKEKQMSELNESNMKMLEERVNLTSVIRREFTSQIEALDQECRDVKTCTLELKAKQKLDLETHQMELEKVRGEKNAEIEQIGLRVKHALMRKEEAIHEFQKQLEKAQIRINHLEQLLEQQRKDFVSSITSNEMPTTTTAKLGSKKK